MFSSRFVALTALAAAVLGCSGERDAGDNAPKADASWAPAKLTTVKGVPATEIEAAITILHLEHVRNRSIG